MSGRRLRLAVAVALAVTVAGCGSSPTSNAGHAALSQLRADVLSLTQAAAARDRSAATAALDRLDADLAAGRAAGTLGNAQVARIRAAADSVRADLETGFLVTATRSSTSSVTTTPKPHPTKTKHHGNGNGRGNG